MTDDDFDALEGIAQLYQEGKVDMAPAIGNVPLHEREFTLNEEGLQYGYDLMRENDDAMLFLIGLVLKAHEPFESEREVAEALIEFCEWFVEDSGINPLRAINRNVDDIPWITGRLPDELVEYYDVEQDEEADDA